MHKDSIFFHVSTESSSTSAVGNQVKIHAPRRRWHDMTFSRWNLQPAGPTHPFSSSSISGFPKRILPLCDWIFDDFYEPNYSKKNVVPRNGLFFRFLRFLFSFFHTFFSRSLRKKFPPSGFAWIAPTSSYFSLLFSFFFLYLFTVEFAFFRGRWMLHLMLILNVQ